MSETYLTNSRKYSRSKVTNNCSKITSEINNLSQGECQDRINELKSFSNRLDEINEKIGTLLFQSEQTDEKISQEFDRCEEYREKISLVKLLDDKIATFHTTNEILTSSRASTDPNLLLGNLKLPELPLPTFGNRDGENLERFFYNFENIIFKYALNDFDRYVFLEKQLSGPPLTLIKSLQGSHQTYTAAKELINKAFSSPTLQKFNIIKRLSNLKLTNSGDIYAFISEMQSIIQVFENLGIDVDSILQYFIWNAMPDKLQTQLINITNNNKPDLDQIKTHIFSAAERYKPDINSRSNEKQFTQSYAVNLEKDSEQLAHIFRPCSLCSKDSSKKIDHPLHKCLVFF